MKHGFKHWDSKKWPANLSNNLVVVLGIGQSTLYLTVNFYKNSFVSSVAKSVGNVSPVASSSPLINGTFLNGAEKSISTTLSVPGPSGWKGIL